jgi:hypothetical protein
MRAGRPWRCVHCALPITLGDGGLVEAETGLEHACPRRPTTVLVPCPSCRQPVTVLADGSVEDWPGERHRCTPWGEWSLPEPARARRPAPAPARPPAPPRAALPL